MICPQCGQPCKGRCACGYQPSAAKGVQWIIQHCATPGCDVAIRERMGQQQAVPICRWCLNNTAYNVVGNPYNRQT